MVNGETAWLRVRRAARLQRLTAPARDWLRLQSAETSPTPAEARERRQLDAFEHLLDRSLRRSGFSG